MPVSQKVLFVSPPFTQLNTPYPATAYLKGFLNTKNIDSSQIDLGLDTILALFSKVGLENLFATAEQNMQNASDNARRIFALRHTYINTISSVISFLQDQDPTLSHLICERKFLPEAERFEEIEDLDWAFGSMGIRDKARHIATLYLEDISDFIVELVDPNFGFSRYAERISMSAQSFDEIYKELQKPETYISNVMLGLISKQIEKEQPTVICLSVPFPGNLFAALTCGAYLKKHFQHIKVIMGGGYPNTELRSLSDARVFEFVDFICLDDGEQPLLTLLSHLRGELETKDLKRTFTLINNEVVYCNNSIAPDIKQSMVGTPDYTGLRLKKYLSVIQLTNPMHRLWSDGRWNKLTLAHGCYWGKCTFCDISLDYIKNYEASSAKLIVDRMEELIVQTGERGFHFVDEAAPPSLMKSVALEILKRHLVVTWWTNIRFEKSFHFDLCRLLAESGCIAVSGGLEVASDRLLDMIAKGVTVKQVAQVNEHFNRAGIMVHAYLMYGFPTQTAQETIDSLEVVRQMFEENILQSAFWHRFAMTAHSPVGIDPQKFKVKALTETKGTFANNDLSHEDPSGTNHGLFSDGLKASLYNFMHGVGFDLPLQKWFKHKVPNASIPKKQIHQYLTESDFREVKANHLIVWIGGTAIYDNKKSMLTIVSKTNVVDIMCDKQVGEWLEKTLPSLSPSSEKSFTYQKLQESYEASGLEHFMLFWHEKVADQLKQEGLLVL
jgi:hypothetical protein